MLLPCRLPFGTSCHKYIVSVQVVLNAYCWVVPYIKVVFITHRMQQFLSVRMEERMAMFVCSVWLLYVHAQ